MGEEGRGDMDCSSEPGVFTAAPVEAGDDGPCGRHEVGGRPWSPGAWMRMKRSLDWDVEVGRWERMDYAFTLLVDV